MTLVTWDALLLLRLVVEQVPELGLGLRGPGGETLAAFLVPASDDIDWKEFAKPEDVEMMLAAEGAFSRLGSYIYV